MLVLFYKKGIFNTQNDKKVQKNHIKCKQYNIEFRPIMG